VTTRDSVEAGLKRLFQVDMPAAVGETTAARRRALRAAHDVRSAPRSTRRFGHSIALALLATLVLAAAAVGVLGLYERVADAAPAGDQIAWARSVELNLTVDSGSGTLTVARGYADANRVVLALGSSSPDVAHSGDLRDAQGRLYTPLGGTGYAELSGESVQLESWLAPEALPAGDLELTLTPQDGAAESWALSFTLPVDGGGVTLVPQQMATVDGVSVTLQDIRFSPTAVICNVQFAGLVAERAWAGTWSVAHEGDASIGEAAMSSAQFGEDPMQQTLIVHTGTDAPSGDWTFRIEELVGVDGDGEQIRLSGPWEFALRVP
jgi:hypothetical protein